MTDFTYDKGRILAANTTVSVVYYLHAGGNMLCRKQTVLVRRPLFVYQYHYGKYLWGGRLNSLRSIKLPFFPGEKRCRGKIATITFDGLFFRAKLSCRMLDDQTGSKRGLCPCKKVIKHLVAIPLSHLFLLPCLSTAMP